MMPDTVEPQPEHLFQTRRFSNDRPTPERKKMNTSFGTLPLGKQKKQLRVTAGICSSQRHFIQHRQHLPKFVSTTKLNQEHNPRLSRAMSYGTLNEPLTSFSEWRMDANDGYNDRSENLLASRRPLVTLSGSNEENYRRFKNVNIHSGNSTLPPLMKNKFKSESDLKDPKFNQQPPALPPRNIPFKNSYVRSLKIERQKSGTFGIVLESRSKIPTKSKHAFREPHFFPIVVGIDPKGSAVKTDLRVGDYVLKINNILVEGMTGKNLDIIIKSSPNKLLLKVATICLAPQKRVGTSRPTPVHVTKPLNPNYQIKPKGKSQTLDRVISTPNHLNFYRNSSRIYEELDESKLGKVEENFPSTSQNLSSDAAQVTVNSSSSAAVAGLKDITGNGELVNSSSAQDKVMPEGVIVKAIVGQNKNSLSLSENSSGFVSEAESPENSSNGSFASSLSANSNGIKDTSNYINLNQDLKSTSNLTNGQAPDSNREDKPPPVPPRMKFATNGLNKPPAIFKNMSSKEQLVNAKRPSGHTTPSPIVNILVPPNTPNGITTVLVNPPSQRQKKKNSVDYGSDDVFIDEYPNTIIQRTHPAPNVSNSSVSHRQQNLLERKHSAEDSQIIFGLKISLKNNKVLKIMRNSWSSSSVGEDSSSLIAPPEDFADSGDTITEPSPSNDKSTNNRSSNLKPSEFKSRVIEKVVPLKTKTVEMRNTKNIKTRETKISNKTHETKMENWSEAEVLKWLLGIGVEERLIQSFAASRVDGKKLLTLQRADLIALGLRKMEARRDFEREIKRVQLRII